MHMQPDETLLHFNNSFESQPWYGESLLQLIDRMTIDQVNHRPTKNTKTAGERLAHIIAWRRLIIKRLQGNAEYIIEMNTPTDWPGPTLYDHESWQAMIIELKETQQQLAALIPEVKDYNAIVPGSKGHDGNGYSYAYMIHGVIEHDIYHQGQMALLVSMLK